MKHIGLQLYSVRNDMAQDVYATLKKTAELGYTGVEFAGYYDIPAKQMKQWLDELGLIAYSTHTNVLADFEQASSYLNELGCKNAVIPGIPGFDSEEDVLGIAQKMTEAGKMYLEKGIKVGYHAIA